MLAQSHVPMLTTVNFLAAFANWRISKYSSSCQQHMFHCLIYIAAANAD